MRKPVVCGTCMLAAALTAQLAGCGGKPKSDDSPGKRLLGEWTGEIPLRDGQKPPLDMDLSATVEFKADGKMSIKAGDMPGPATGTWKVASEEDDKIGRASCRERV